MAPPQKPGGDGKGLDGLLLQGSEAVWGGSGGDGGGGGGGGGGGCGGDAAEETMEWRSMGQRVVAVESCLFVLQVLKAARRRTIGDYYYCLFLGRLVLEDDYFEILFFVTVLSYGAVQSCLHGRLPTA